MSEDEKDAEPREGRTAAQWIAAGIGLTLSLALFALIGWRAIQPGELAPPAITISAQHTSGAGTGYLVEFVARNQGDETAAGVMVEGQLTVPGSPEETSSTTLDYVPGRSTRKGGLFFTADPRRGQLELRALGYSEP